MEPFDAMQPIPEPVPELPPEVLAEQERMRIAAAVLRRIRRTAAVRSRTNRVTAMSFLYIAILTACVFAAGFVSMLFTLLTEPSLLQRGFNAVLTRLLDAFSRSSFGYLLAVPALYLMVFLWKKKPFFKNVLFASRRRMSGGVLLFLISLLFLAQAVTDGYVRGLDWLLGFLGTSASGAMAQSDTSVAMLLYTCIGAPFIEEILFRGAVMRSLQNFGRRFAVVASALIFGLIHGNLVQTPFAFLVGLVLGYAAMEYGIWWSIALHFFNNAIIAELLERLFRLLPGNWGGIASYALTYGVALVAVVVCIVRRKRIAAVLHAKKTQKGTYRGFFRSPLLWVMVGYTAVSSAAILLLFSLQ